MLARTPERCATVSVVILRYHSDNVAHSCSIVEEDIASALVMEDDADWDVSLKSQMTTFARATSSLMQPLLNDKTRIWDPSYPAPSTGDLPAEIDSSEELVVQSSVSPYGDTDRWDVLWPGHCGSRFPLASDVNVPIGRVIIRNDTTVPERRFLDMELGDDQLLGYPSGTRIVTRARVNSCTTAYAVSKNGAERMLSELIRKLDHPIDVILRYICDGVEGRSLAKCYSVQPQYFQQHRPEGPKSAYSNIDIYDGYNARPYTKNIRHSMRLNSLPMIEGRTDFQN